MGRKSIKTTTLENIPATRGDVDSLTEPAALPPAADLVVLAPVLSEHPGPEDQPNLTIPVALKNWLTTLTESENGELAANRGAVIAFAREVSRDTGEVKLLREVTASDLADARTRLLAYLSRDPQRLLVVNRALTALRQFFLWATGAGLTSLHKNLILYFLAEASAAQTQSVSVGTSSTSGSSGSSLEAIRNANAALQALPTMPSDLSTLDDAALRQLATQYIQALKSTALYRQAQTLQEAVNARVNAVQSRSRSVQIAGSANSDKTRVAGPVAGNTGALRSDTRIDVH